MSPVRTSKKGYPSPHLFVLRSLLYFQVIYIVLFALRKAAKMLSQKWCIGCMLHQSRIIT